MTIAAQVIGTQLVAHDKKDILDHISKDKDFFCRLFQIPKRSKNQISNEPEDLEFQNPFLPINFLAIENNACHLSGELWFR
jgi:hypothetical protein|tara:strand:+ start:141 stop:383 length:243 start_codon:yes stop_codon:yes gene_type:complete